jgi:hypothetical protein
MICKKAERKGGMPQPGGAYLGNIEVKVLKEKKRLG